MSYGYNGKILRVDLSREEIAIEEHDEYFYRTYMGGATLGAYYLLKEQKAGVDPLSPENIIVIAPSIVTGTPAPGFSRYAIVSKSPLTGAIGDTQAGGFWGPELKFAGYDAIVIKGKAKSPVYLFIQDGEVKIKKAAHLWGKTTGEVEQIIHKEHSDPRIRVLSIGCAGENLVRFANVLSDCKHAAGRLGMGAIIAFAMKCYEKGIISKDDTGGISLKFGDAKAMLRMLEMTAKREGIGDILAEGSKRAAKRFGKGAERFAVQVKGEELAMHDGRVKGMVGFAYAVSPIGADHVVVEHDTDFDFNAPDIFIEQMKSLGLLKRCKTSGMNHQKMRMFCYLQNHFSFMDSLCLCVFAFAPVRTFKMSHLVEIASAVTGWELSLWEMMKLGERRVNMFKAFNVREGFTADDDWLPPRMFESIQSGLRKGSSFSEDELRKMRELYYKMQN